MRISDWSSDVCSSDLDHSAGVKAEIGFDAVHAIGGKAVFIAAFRRERIKGDARWRQQRKAGEITGLERVGIIRVQFPGKIIVRGDCAGRPDPLDKERGGGDRKSTRLNSSH